MGLLGQTHLANNLNQLAKAANQGALPVTKELEDELWAACAGVHEMRRALMRALGIAPTAGHQPLTETFADSARGAR